MIVKNQHIYPYVLVYFCWMSYGCPFSFLLLPRPRRRPWPGCWLPLLWLGWWGKDCSMCAVHVPHVPPLFCPCCWGHIQWVDVVGFGDIYSLTATWVYASVGMTFICTIRSRHSTDSVITSTFRLPCTSTGAQRAEQSATSYFKYGGTTCIYRHLFLHFCCCCWTLHYPLVSLCVYIRTDCQRAGLLSKLGWDWSGHTRLGMDTEQQKTLLWTEVFVVFDALIGGAT